MMMTFKVLSVLLSYPTAEVQQHIAEMQNAVCKEGVLTGQARRALNPLFEDLARGELYDLQERYVLLFDRTRSLSLHLFEHVHGESRDRGQAMVDLQTMYVEKGLEPGTSELPDFLPLFLEFLSTQPADEARALLAQAVEVVALLRARLEQRGAPYAVVFRAIETLAPRRADPAAIRDTVAGEAPDDTPAALDRAWEEAPVTFGSDPGVASGAGCSAASAMVARFAPPPGADTTAHRSGTR